MSDQRARKAGRAYTAYAVAWGVLSLVLLFAAFCVFMVGGSTEAVGFDYALLVIPVLFVCAMASLYAMGVCLVEADRREKAEKARHDERD